MTDARARSSRAWSSGMSSSCCIPHSGAEHRERRLQVDARVPRANRERVRLGRREAGLVAAVHQEAPDLLERNVPDEVLDVDAAVTEGAALLVRLGDFGLEGNHALEAGLDLAQWAPFLGGRRIVEGMVGASRKDDEQPPRCSRPSPLATRTPPPPQPSPPPAAAPRLRGTVTPAPRSARNRRHVGGQPLAGWWLSRRRGAARRPDHRRADRRRSPSPSIPRSASCSG